PALEPCQHGRKQCTAIGAVAFVYVTARRAGTWAMPEHLGDGVEESPLEPVWRRAHRATGKVTRMGGHEAALSGSEHRAVCSAVANGDGKRATVRPEERPCCDEPRRLVDRGGDEVHLAVSSMSLELAVRRAPRRLFRQIIEGLGQADGRG